MKTLISTVLALTLLGTAAASAQSYGGNYGGHERSMSSSYRGNQGNYGHDYNRGGYGNYRGNAYRGRNDGALFGLGLGLFALAAIAASQHQQDYRGNGYDGGYYGR